MTVINPEGAIRGPYTKLGINLDDVREMKAAFDLLDVHGEGEIDLLDAIDSLESLGVSRLEQEPIMLAMRSAAKKAPTMDFEGLVEEMAPLLNVDVDDKECVRRAWRILDEERKG